MFHKLTRRHWLVGSGSTLGATLLGGTRAAAHEGPTRNLIIVVAGGGWDTTYAIDPKPTSLPTIDVPAGTIEEISGIPLLTDPLRPSVTGFFRDFGDLTAVVNGLQLQSISHTDGFKRILTGTASDKSPDYGAITAHEHGRDLPAPYLVLGTTAFAGPYASLATRTGTTNQLGTLIDPLARFPVEGEPLSWERYIPDAREADLIGTYARAGAARELQARGLLGRNHARLESFASAIERADLLRDVGGLQGFNSTVSLAFQVDLAVDALASGMSRVVQIGMDGFDTHAGNAAQALLWEALFAQLYRLLLSLEGRDLLEDTVVVVISELGRTPLLNDQAGKDHWPVTSALVVGTEVAGGSVIGGTDEGLGGRNVDLQTGAPDAEGTPLRHTNFAAGVLDLVGVDSELYLPTATPLTALRG